LFYLLTGQVAFAGDSVPHRLAQHQTSPVPDVRTFCACPPAVAELLLRMMSKRPEDRPPSVGELLNWVLRINGGDETTNRIKHVVPASDTMINDAPYQLTIGDSSVPGENAVVKQPNLNDEIDGIDFDDLPAIDHVFDSEIGSEIQVNAARSTTAASSKTMQSKTTQSKTTQSPNAGCGSASPQKRPSQSGQKAASNATQILKPRERLIKNAVLSTGTAAVAIIVALLAMWMTSPDPLPKFEKTVNAKGERVFVIRD
ncbi:MAG: hypothetical protein HKN47_22410, partial [Pirellulaceae bacterium]|nr:hypothetical protein [Pirellulaceae bacterium]